MPGYRTHLMGGFAVYAISLYFLQSVHPTLLTMIEWLGCALVGSLFPDLDTKSKGQLWLYRILFVVLLILVYKKRFFVAALSGVICLLPMLFKHRGLFHRPLFLVGVPVVGMVLVQLYAPASAKLFLYDALFFTAGAMSHIVLDRGMRAFF